MPVQPVTPPGAKPRYEILDGLRGVAALAVVVFHLFEAHSGGNAFRQLLNHGYLAVDFFFLLSGFVVGYAYDDRWDRMSYLDFLRRRLIRLQPMVVMGAVIGAALFYFGASRCFPGIAAMPVSRMLLIALAGALMVPVTRAGDVRGWHEMYPLNGPAWSLFFEYFANVAYAVILRRLATRVLAVLAGLTAVLTVHYLFTSREADMIGGWELSGAQLRVGFTRLLFPFVAGLLLFRLGRRFSVRHGFWVCSALLLILLAMPRLGTRQLLWPNAAYESLCILLLFPLLVAIGAGSELHTTRSHRICVFLGRLSYPLYITHYPLIYLYTAWVSERHLGLPAAWPLAAAVFVLSVAVGYLTLRLYDEPLRGYLTQRWLKR